MAAKDRAALKIGVGDNYPDNTTGDITPLNDRTQHIDEIDSALNIIDTAIQNVAGAVNFQGALTKSGAPVVTGLITVATEADFPTQDGTTITLEANTVYLVTASFTTAKRFIHEAGAAITALNRFGITITYTGSGTMFTGVDVTGIIFDISLNAPSGQLFDYSDVAVPNAHIAFIRNVNIVSCNKYATFTDLASWAVVESNALSCNDGISVMGTGWRAWRFQNSGFLSSDASFIGLDLGTATCDTIILSDLLFAGPSGAIGVSGLAGSGNVTANNLAKFVDVNFTGAITPIVGLTVDDIRWYFALNDQIADTMPDAMASLNSNATETVIAAANTPVKVAGTWVSERQSQWTADTTGRLTYNGERPITVPSDIVAVTEAASGTNKDITTYLALNGSIISNSGKPNRVSANDPKSNTVLWQLTVNQNDYLEVFTENNTDTTNLITVSGINRAR